MPTTNRTKLLVLAAVVVVAVALLVTFRQYLSLAYLAEREADLRSYRDAHPVLVLAIAFAVYVAVTGLSLPGAAAMSLAYAWLLGFWQAVVLISFASTTGATVAFLLSRYLVGASIQARYADRLRGFNDALARDGPFYLFTLRLTPVVPFFVVNLVMGLTPIRARTFWWVSQLGMLPGTCVYVYAGSRVPSLATLAEQGAGGILDWQLLVAFALLGLFPLGVKKIVDRFRPRRVAADVPSEPTEPTA
jgi:uncharacterized membrane protein YdjX (TVP38/TMEM64 family)